MFKKKKKMMMMMCRDGTRTYRCRKKLLHVLQEIRV